MFAYAIVMKDVEVSEHGYQKLVESSARVGNRFNIQKFEAITPQYVDKTMASQFIKWNYPWDKTEHDMASGLIKHPYTTANPQARIACALSHYLLWKTAVKMRQPILILEHDAVFINAIDFTPNQAGRYEIIGINDPRGATRKSAVYHQKIVDNRVAIQQAPWIDDDMSVPQGLAGNSAYIIKPSGAQKMIDLTKQYGLWPNDALMCKQLIRTLAVTKKYYTTIQGLRSTTST